MKTVEITITGPAGAGKTTLLHSIAKHLIGQGFNLTCFDPGAYSPENNTAVQAPFYDLDSADLDDRPITLNTLSTHSAPAPAPDLATLRTQLCTVPELQAALVQLIDLYNEQGKALEKSLNSKGSHSDTFAVDWMNRRYGL